MKKKKKDKERRRLQWPYIKPAKKSLEDISSSDDIIHQFCQFETHYFSQLDNQERNFVEYIDQLSERLAEIKTEVIKTYESEREESRRQFTIMRDRILLPNSEDYTLSLLKSKTEENESLKRQIQQLKAQLGVPDSAELESKNQQLIPWKSAVSPSTTTRNNGPD